VMADVWVGSWRPHKPRGPIAALYSSPGPKYALPGLTGHNHHDPRKYKAPVFSFGTRHGQSGSDTSPGPRYLIPSNITRLGRDGTPAFSLYSRPRDPELFQAPGPGQYSPEHSGKSVYSSAPAYSLSGRSKDFGNDQTPGNIFWYDDNDNVIVFCPAAYMLPAVLGPKAVTTSTAPNYSLCGRSKIGSFHEDLQKTPGPGAYKVIDPTTYKYKAPQYSIIGRNSISGDSTKKPGPGAHYPERVTFTRSRAPSFSFGVRHSQYIAPLIMNVAE
uniref:Tripartite motif containing 35-30 n=1 Tax=Myripristis murdjan TaxID=586833 RepID=A0A668A4R1_9TELE